VAAGLLAAGLAAGTLVALPQIVEFLRILPASARSLGFLPRVRTAGSFDPRQALDWLLPFAFGRPDRLGPGSFWGMRYYQESWAFFFTLYPGLPAIALVAAAGWRLRHRVARVGWGLAASGVFLALGRFNPVAEWLFTRQALEVLRYPLKLWFFVAVGLSLLCGLGFERAVVAGDGEARRRATVTLAGLAALVIGLWAALRLAPVTMAAALLARMSASAPRAYGAFEVARWSGLALASAAVAAAAVGLLALARRRPGAAGAALLALHAGAQLLLLRPALATDATLPYRTPTRLLDALPAEELVVHGSDQGLFGPRTVMSGVFPAPEARWIYRRAAHEAYPTMAGQLFGRRYELNTSPEALDPVPTRRAVTAVENAASDGERLRLLAAWGVARLVVDREIAATDRRGLAEPVASAPSFRQRVWVYRLPGAAPEVYLATRLLPVSHDRRAAAVISGDGFRPGRDAVVVTAGPVVHSPGPHQVEVRSAGTEELSARVVAPGPALLVWQRAWSPLYRATVDGRPTPPVKANLYRLGVPVPGGEHEVRLWVDRRPLGVSLGAAAAGGAGLLALLAVGLGRLRRHPAGPPPGP
jgi:hypothetical protein